MIVGRSGVSRGSFDRKYLLAALSIGVIAIILVAIRLGSRIYGAGEYDDILFWAEIAAAIMVTAGVVAGAPLAIRELGELRKTAASALEARIQIEQLFQMTDMLQSAAGYADANAVLRATAAQLLPGFGGALYVFNNSRDRLDLSTAWDWPEDRQPSDLVSPTHCWALKRGKSHINQIGVEALRCEHQAADVVVLEIPMMARGEVYGLLNVQAAGEDATHRLSKIMPLAGAMADAMSLTLSNSFCR